MILDNEFLDTNIITSFSKHSFLKEAGENLWIELQPYTSYVSSSSSQIIATFEPETRFYLFAIKGKLLIYSGGKKIGELSANQIYTSAFWGTDKSQSFRIEAALPAELLIIQFPNISHALNVEIKLLSRLLRWFTFLPEPGTQKIESDDDLIGMVRKYKNSQNHLFSILNHDLRSPIASVISLLDMSQAELKEGNFSMVEQLLGDIQELAVVHLKMLENLKTWAELRAFRKKPVIKTTDIDCIIQNAIGLCYPHFQKKEITLTLNNDLPKEFHIINDPQLVTFILNELLLNACKFSYRNQEVKVELRIQDNNFIINIKDHGKGIRPNLLEGLFTVGKNRIDYGTENEPGTGLGLLIVKEMVDLIGAEIKVESELGKGSTFTLVFPLSQ